MVSTDFDSALPNRAAVTPYQPNRVTANKALTRCEPVLPKQNRIIVYVDSRVLAPTSIVK